MSTKKKRPSLEQIVKELFTPGLPKDSYAKFCAKWKIDPNDKSTLGVVADVDRIRVEGNQLVVTVNRLVEELIKDETLRGQVKEAIERIAPKASKDFKELAYISLMETKVELIEKVSEIVLKTLNEDE